MPQACENLFARSKIRAWANEVGVKVVSVVGGKLNVEPIRLPDSVMTPLRREGARYIAQSRKLQVPMKHFDEMEENGLMQGIWEFLFALKPIDAAGLPLEPEPMANTGAAGGNASSAKASPRPSTRASRSAESATRASNAARSVSGSRLGGKPKATNTYVAGVRTTRKPKAKLNIPTPPKNPSAPAQGSGRPVPFTPGRPSVAPDGRPASSGTLRNRRR